MKFAQAKVAPLASPRLVAGAVLVGAVFLFTRLSGLDADPPADMQVAVATDEGWWAHNARNHALFGRWVMDDMNFGLYAAPVYTLLQRLSYAIGGVDLAATRLVSIAAGFTTLVALVLIVGREGGARAALAAAALWSIDYFVTSFNRVGFVESTATAFMTLALLASLSRGRPRLGALVGGALALVACFTKMNSIFFLPVIPLTILLRHWAASPSDRGRLPATIPEALVPFCAGALVVGCAGWVFFVLPNWGPFMLQNALVSAANVRIGWFYLLSMPFSVGLVVRDNHAYAGGFIYQCLALIVAGALWFVLVACRAAQVGWRRQLDGLGRDELAAFCWVIVFLVCLAFTTHSPDRRYYPLSVPLAILGANLLTRRSGEPFGLLPGIHKRQTAWPDLVPAAAACLVIAIYARIPLANAFEPLTRNADLGRMPGLTPDARCGIATVILVVVLIAPLRFALRLASAARLRGKHVAISLAGLALVFGARMQASAYAARTYTLRDTSAWLSTTVGKDACVAGGVAETLLFGSTARTFAVQDRRFLGFGVVNGDRVPDLRPTHCLLDGDISEKDLSRQVASYLQGWGAPVGGTRACRGLCPDALGRPRLFVTLCGVAPVTAMAESGP